MTYEDVPGQGELADGLADEQPGLAPLEQQDVARIQVHQLLDGRQPLQLQRHVIREPLQHTAHQRRHARVAQLLAA